MRVGALGATLALALGLSGLTGAEVARAAADVDADGRMDLVWRDPPDALLVWRLAGPLVTELTPPALPPGAVPVGLADLDGDGRTELLWWALDGLLGWTALDGSTASGIIGPGPGPGGQPVGLGDVDGDGRAELLWRTPGDLLEVWQVAGGPASLGILAAWPAGADLLDVADLDGNGTADLLWEFADGRLEVWRLQGLEVLATAAAGALAAAERVAGVADVDGDGQGDLLVHGLDRRLEVWRLVGGGFVDRAPLGTAGVTWGVVAVGDLDGDGHPDVVFQASSGALVAWLLDGPTVAGAVELPLVPDRWALVPGQPGPRLALERGGGAPVPRIRVAAGDLNGDGWVEMLGTLADGQGGLAALPLAAAGLDALFAGGRVHRDNRLADLDGDGRLDLVANTYSAIDDPAGPALLFRGGGDGTFTEDPAFRALGLRGFGETIVVADFDNDGDLDLFIPYYAFSDPREQAYLLVNDGQGHFSDVADEAGVSLRGVPVDFRPEGAQAVDVDGDGWIDLYVASRLFHNQGGLRFTDVSAAAGLPASFDEGARFLDWNRDGRLDLLLHNPGFGPRLFEFDGSAFHERNVFPVLAYREAYGANVADVDQDGRDDIVVSGGPVCRPVVLINTGVRFVPAVSPALDGRCTETLAGADVDGDGRLDLLAVEGDPLEPGVLRQWTYYNRSEPAGTWFVVEVVGPGGQPGQHGRVVRASPLSAPGVVLTQVVDGGSGYMAQGQYPLLFRSPFVEPHRVTVAFAAGTREVIVEPAETLRVAWSGTRRVEGAAVPGRAGPPGVGPITLAGRHVARPKPAPDAF